MITDDDVDVDVDVDALITAVVFNLLSRAWSEAKRTTNEEEEE
jgi:uncharacterized membrane protein